MRWVWTDDLAELLVRTDRVEPHRLTDWVAAPVAYRIAEDDDALGLARRLLDPQRSSPGAAA